ncbi:MerR family transcriptional regulator [Adlercreutzia shanghongiae]|uniref:MerR family transcriptional regulator n=1 Tax=Adlercreutzia shanghongiae TaxID=3111773 RepID=A0ABU6IYS2_9ACTN|nr:MerR family transcriptional regulator [Adlercreutzia sp. R22]MEC4295016.1 MerR family transcriptional regulator [Adlercreutzia sp. R22]
MRSNEVAKLAGVTVRTLRHYHQLGILPEPPRSANGYRDYPAADVARVLRVKRLASLGFPLARIGEILEDMDAPGSSAAAALDDLDRELALEIERLEEQRRTIAALRTENLDPTLPVRFARILSMLPGVSSLADASPADRTAIVVAGHLYNDDELDELERVVGRIASDDLIEAFEQLNARIESLRPDAPEEERDALAQQTLDALAPVIACFDAANWLRPSTDRERFLDEIAFRDYNDAQQDVYNRVEAGIEAAMTARLEAEQQAEASKAASS